MLQGVVLGLFCSLCHLVGLTYMTEYIISCNNSLVYGNKAIYIIVKLNKQNKKNIYICKAH